MVEGCTVTDVAIACVVAIDGGSAGEGTRVAGASATGEAMAEVGVDATLTTVDTGADDTGALPDEAGCNAVAASEDAALTGETTVATAGADVTEGVDAATLWVCCGTLAGTLAAAAEAHDAAGAVIN